MGCRHIDMFSDVDNADLILVWGTDPSTSTPPEMFQRLKRAAEEGAEIIVIDPRKTKAAFLDGSQWLPVRPGSDGALALGMAHILIRDELYDAEFVADWTHGFEEFADYVKDFTPEHVCDLTASSRIKLKHWPTRLSRRRGRPMSCTAGLEYTKSGVQNIRAVMVLWALAANWMSKVAAAFCAGTVFCRSPQRDNSKPPRIQSIHRRRQVSGLCPLLWWRTPCPPVAASHYR